MASGLMRQLGHLLWCRETLRAIFTTVPWSRARNFCTSASFERNKPAIVAWFEKNPFGPA